MKIHYSLSDLAQIKNPVVTTGAFDGVHVGHRVIISRLRKLASDISGESVLITFHPHPRRVLYPDTKGKDLLLICSPSEKIRLLAETGLDHLVIINFTPEFSKLTPEGFVEDIIIAKLHAKIVVIGFNHHFGCGRRGDLEYLFKLGRKHGFEVEEIPEQDVQNESVSSTKIRKALQEGNIQRASAYLDHFFLIEGDAGVSSDESEIPGTRVFNFKIEDNTKIIPPDGVYAVNIEAEGNMEKGMLIVSGMRVMNNILSPDLVLRISPILNADRFEDKKVLVYVQKQICTSNSEPDKKLLINSLREIGELIF